MKNYFVYIFIFFGLNSLAQEYQWTGSSNTEDFFDEFNWKETTTDEYPPTNSINPEEPIQFNLFITCNVVANGEISLEENVKITIINGELDAEKIRGIGEIILNESSYLNINTSYPIDEGILIKINSDKSWVRLYDLEPTSALYYYQDNFYNENQILTYPETLRIDNYYSNGSIIRKYGLNNSNLSVYSDEGFNGESIEITSNIVHVGESILENLNDNISSFILKRGYMATFAENEDGSGNSKVFIASENDIAVSELSEYLNNKISFIRVVPWNWVTKKGTAGDILNMGNDWFYKWSNNGNSDINREYSPMAWGKGAADDDDDIEIIKDKYKSTHILAFNEPDDCNGQSGQYGNMCVVDTSLTYYKNLLKSGLRTVSPACRQGGVFDWLNEFNSKAVDQKIRIDVIAVHWYDWASNPENSPNANPQDIFNRFVNYLDSVHQIYNLPIWITEFNANKYRNEWVHRQFLQLALPFLEETEYIERYAFFEPVTDVANFFDENNNFTQIGEYYHNFMSTNSIVNEQYSSPSNLNYDDYEFNELECDPNNSFLSENIIDLIPEISVYPNPSKDVIFINIHEEIKILKIISLNGKVIKNLEPKNNINISFLEEGMYLINVNNYFVKFLKN